MKGTVAVIINKMVKVPPRGLKAKKVVIYRLRKKPKMVGKSQKRLFLIVPQPRRYDLRHLNMLPRPRGGLFREPTTQSSHPSTQGKQSNLCLERNMAPSSDHCLKVLLCWCTHLNSQYRVSRIFPPDRNYQIPWNVCTLAQKIFE